MPRSPTCWSVSPRRSCSRRVRAACTTATPPGSSWQRAVRHVRVGRGLHVRAPRAVLRRHGRTACAGRAHQGCACAGLPGRLHHHRPHLARGQHRVGFPGGEVPEERGVVPADFNTYGARRGNHEVMMRGTFANVKLSNKLAEGQEGRLDARLPEGARSPAVRCGYGL